MKIPKLIKISSEKAVLKTVSEQAESVMNAVYSLRELYQHLKRGEWGKANEKAFDIARYERMADRSRERVALMIFRGSFVPDFREVIMNLIENIDRVADDAKDTSRIMTQRIFDVEVLKILEPHLELYIELIVRAVKLMVESIKNLTINLDKSLEIARKVEEVEVKVDEVKSLLITQLYRRESDIDILTILQLKDMILFMDNIADDAEDVSDIIELLYLILKT